MSLIQWQWGAGLGWTALAGPSAPAAPGPGVVPLLERSYFYGRNYFLPRSGRAQLILQTDHADLAPAVLYVLFDAQDIRQSARKERAFNFGVGTGFERSALQVVLGGFPFTALGHETVTGWAMTDGIPAAEATWWAGGLQVTEQFLALADEGVFLRRIKVASRNLAGPESIHLRLFLPGEDAAVRHGWLEARQGGACLGLGLGGAMPNAVSPARGMLDCSISLRVVLTVGLIQMDTST